MLQSVIVYTITAAILWWLAHNMVWRELCQLCVGAWFLFILAGDFVESFLNLFRYADLVITSSFHGTAFAINMGRPVISMVTKNGDEPVIEKQLGESYENWLRSHLASFRLIDDFIEPQII